MNIFGRCIFEVIRILSLSSQHLLKGGNCGLRLIFGEDAGTNQCATVSHACHNISFKQTLIKAERIVESGKSRIGFAAESPAPKIFCLSHSRHSSTNLPDTSQFSIPSTPRLCKN